MVCRHGVPASCEEREIRVVLALLRAGLDFSSAHRAAHRYLCCALPPHGLPLSRPLLALKQGSCGHCGRHERVLLLFLRVFRDLLVKVLRRCCGTDTAAEGLQRHVCCARAVFCAVLPLRCHLAQILEIPDRTACFTVRLQDVR